MYGLSTKNVEKEISKTNKRLKRNIKMCLNCIVIPVNSVNHPNLTDVKLLNFVQRNVQRGTTKAIEFN